MERWVQSAETAKVLGRFLPDQARWHLSSRRRGMWWLLLGHGAMTSWEVCGSAVQCFACGCGVGRCFGRKLAGSCRLAASASADVVSPPWRRRRGDHPLHTLGSSPSGESLRPCQDGRQRKHRQVYVRQW